MAELLCRRKVFGYFRDVDERRRGSPRGIRLVGGSKLMNIMVVHWVFITEWSRVL